jgi:uncharacterized repeat protein (TIGR02543 family)
MAWQSGSISYTSVSVTQTSVTVSWSASLTFNNRTYGLFDVYLTDGNGGDHLIGTIPSFTTTSGSTTSQTRTVTGSGTWPGLSAGTTYSGNFVAQKGRSSGITYATSSTFSFTTDSPPPPPTLYSYPTLSGSTVSGSQLSVSSGSYSSGTISSTRIAYATEPNTAYWTYATTSTPSSRTSPYTVTDSDASSPPYYFAAVDAVLSNGTTYYFFSYPQVSYLKVSFNANSGSSVSAIPYIANSSNPNYISLPYTSRDGYTFNGWYTASSGGTYVGGAYSGYQPSTSVSSTLYAQWTPLPVSQNYSPSLSGSAIAGTQLSGTAGSYNYAASIDTRIAYNTTGSFPTNENQTSQANPYTVTDGDASYVPFYFATKDTVLGTDGLVYYFYSSPIISKLTVSFNSNGGSSVDPISFTAAPGNSITLPYVSRNLYTFNGWYTSSSGGTRVGGIYDSYTTSETVRVTLYAQWTLTPISQNYAPSIYGSGISGTSLSVSSGGYSNGTYLGTDIAYGTENDFATYNNTSTQWFQTKTSPYTIVDRDAEAPAYYFAAVDRVQNGAGVVYYYYSSSIKAGFQITYVYDNGYPNTTEPFYSASPNPTLILPSPEKTGNEFSGWFDSETGGTLVGLAGANYTPPNTNKTLYAQWTPITYTLTYDANGGSVSPSTKQIDSGAPYGDLPTPEKAGYTFLGWYKTLDFTSQILSSSTYEEGDDSRIYARWQGNTYVLTLYPNFPLGGKLDAFYSQNNVTYGSPYGELPVLTRSGYSFDGWFDQEVGGSKITSETLYLLEANSDLYAHWIASNPIFSDQAITTTAYLNKDVNTLIDNKVTASPVTEYSIVYSGTGLNPSSWLSISKESGTNNGIISGKPSQVGVYTFIIRATSSSGGSTDSGLITMTVYPAGKRSLESSMTSLTVAKRFDGTNWIDMKIMRRFDGQSWQDISNI